MKIYIELLVVLIAMIIFLIWFVWFMVSKKYNNWRYKEKNDRGKIGEDHRQELIKAGQSDPSAGIRREVSRSTETDSNFARQREPERRELLSSATVDVGGEKGSSSGRTSPRIEKSIRNPFRRRK